MALADIRDQPLPERDGLGVRVVDPEDRDPRVAPAEHDVADRAPEPFSVGRLPVEVVDVLVALRRVLGVLQRPVGPVLEPLGMLGEPGVVGRHLQREVERELHAVLAQRADQAGEVGVVAETRMDRVVPALGRADRPGAPDIARLGAFGIVAALAVRAANRVDRREVDDVEAELRELRDDPCHTGEPAPGSREQLVPGARAGALPLHLDLERATARRLAAITRPERRCRGAPLLDRSRTEERRPFRQLACEVGLPRRDLAVVLVEPAGVPVDPRLDLEAPAPDGIDVEGSREAVVAERLERRLAPAAPGPAVADDAAERLVPVPGDRGVDLDAVADARLRGPAAAVDLRRDVGHVDALGSHLRHTVNSPACAWNGHSASSSIRPRFRAGAWGRRRMRSSTGSRTRARAGGRCCRSTRRTRSAPRTRPRRHSRAGAGFSKTPMRRSARGTPAPFASASRAGSETGPHSPATVPSTSRSASSANGERCARTPPHGACGSSGTCRSTSPSTAATTPHIRSSSSRSTTWSRARRRMTSTTSDSSGGTRSTTGT